MSGLEYNLSFNPRGFFKGCKMRYEKQADGSKTFLKSLKWVCPSFLRIGKTTKWYVYEK